MSLIFLILFKKEANWSTNDFSDSCDGSVTSDILFRGYMQQWYPDHWGIELCPIYDHANE